MHGMELFSEKRGILIADPLDLLTANILVLKCVVII
jgi:hypothetical protein